MCSAHPPMPACACCAGFLIKGQGVTPGRLWCVAATEDQDKVLYKCQWVGDSLVLGSGLLWHCICVICNL